MWKAFLDTLPRGYALEEQDWRRRHRLPLNLLTGHIPALAVIGGLFGRGVLALVTALVIPSVCVVLGHLLRHHRRAAAVSVTLGLVWCSAGLVGLTGGAIEAHFHFFVIIGFIALYQDWIPFLFMILFTVVSHVLGSTWQRDLIFSHGAGQANPWLWSLIHGVAVLFACVGIVLFWHVTEDVQEKSLLARRLADTEAGKRKFTSDLLINLARRNQSMLYRQLEIINQLEESERDPDTLAELFTLDHLATRVRRNAESLLVLSGEQPPRTWSRPVPIRDVLRAAIAETEDLDRVVFVADEHLAVAGHTVTDLTHLIAELTENAVRFSPPDSTVAIRARPNRQQPGGQLLTVEDWGVGMPPPQLAAANALLAKPPEVDLSVSQRLGFHVVARLAARHGIAVSLSATPGSGITAMIVLPPALFAATPVPDTGPVAGVAPAPVMAGVTAAVPVLAAAAPLTISIPAVRRPVAESLTTPSAAPNWHPGNGFDPVGWNGSRPGTVEPADRLQSDRPQPEQPQPDRPATVDARHALDEPAAGPERAQPDGPEARWLGWWTAEAEPASGTYEPDRAAASPTEPAAPQRTFGSTAAHAAVEPSLLEPPQQLPSPRPRATPTPPQLPPQSDRRAAARPTELAVDPVSGLRKRVPQAHLAPELREPTVVSDPAASAFPSQTVAAANALSRYQASRLAARTTTPNEHGWLS